MPAQQHRLIAPGVAMGGARPKALISTAGAPWVLKFTEPGESIDLPLVKHATMTLAASAGIAVAQTRPLALNKGHAVAVKRFDRVPASGAAGGVGMRVHALSAHVALKAAGERLGYPELAQLLRRHGVAASGLAKAQMAELFRRMVFNILIDRNGKPLVRITQLVSTKRPIKFGVLKGKLKLAADFNAPLAADVLAGFEGR